MSNFSKRVICFLTLSFLYFCAAFAQAESKAVYQYGTVDAIYHQDSAVVIGDIYYRLRLDLKVYDYRGDKVNRYSLRQGQKVAFVVDSKADLVTYEIRIKPSDFKFPEIDD
jgi:hypothetical protein